MNAIALQSTPTLRKRRMAIADFNFKCDRPSNFATPYRYATSTNTSKVRSSLQFFYPLLICNIYKHFKSAIGKGLFI